MLAICTSLGKKKKKKHRSCVLDVFLWKEREELAQVRNSCFCPKSPSTGALCITCSFWAKSKPQLGNQTQPQRRPALGWPGHSEMSPPPPPWCTPHTQRRWCRAPGAPSPPTSPWVWGWFAVSSRRWEDLPRSGEQRGRWRARKGKEGLHVKIVTRIARSVWLVGTSDF